MPPAIPDRWLEYRPIGKKIEGTRFIAFKVPLEKHVARRVSQDARLDGEILLEKIPNLGLIIDLTNTHRFYNPSFFEIKGIAYEKIMIPGQTAPSKILANKFTEVVKKFIATNKDNDKLIGVHCTHGVNRTGYLICNYMIREMNVKPQEAVNRFEKYRGHKIERTNYIESLHILTREQAGNYGIEPQSEESRKIINSSNTSGRNSHWHTNNTCVYNQPGEKSFEKKSNNPTSRLRIDYYNNEPYETTRSYNYKRKKNDF